MMWIDMSYVVNPADCYFECGSVQVQVGLAMVDARSVDVSPVRPLCCACDEEFSERFGDFADSTDEAD